MRYTSNAFAAAATLAAAFSLSIGTACAQPGAIGGYPSAQPPTFERLVEAVRANPGDLNLRRQLAQALLSRGLTVKAAEQMQGVIRVAGQNAGDLCLLADAARYSGNLSSAVQSYKQALSLSPMCGKAWVGLSLAYATAGDYQTAFNTCNHGLSQIADLAGRQELTNTMQTIRGMQTSATAVATASAAVTQ
jgi:Flp pilus assembly protein TadD